jgi:spore cortex biosynthesis protein YabQ
MNEVIYFQITTFFSSVLYGILISVFYDVWKHFWKCFCRQSQITDSIFWIFAGIGLFLFTEWMNQGNIRGYLFLGWLSGWLIYVRIFRRVTKRIGIQWLKLLKKIRKTVKICIGRR